MCTREKEVVLRTGHPLLLPQGGTGNLDVSEGVVEQWRLAPRLPLTPTGASCCKVTGRQGLISSPPTCS